MELMESAGAPIRFSSFFSGSLFVPAIMNVTSFSYWILSRMAASGEI